MNSPPLYPLTLWFGLVVSISTSGCNFSDPLSEAGSADQSTMILDMPVEDMTSSDASAMDMSARDMPDDEGAQDDGMPDGMDQAPDMAPEPCTSNPIFSSGNGTSQDPFIICDATQYLRIGDASGSFYALERDIDLAGLSPEPIDVFTGQLDGRGFSIRNLSVAGDASFGGFCNVLTGTLRDVNFVDIEVRGRGPNVGGIAYLSQGATVKDLGVSGSVEGLSYVGLFGARISNGPQGAGLYENVLIQGTVNVTGKESGNESGAKEGYSGLFVGRIDAGVSIKRVHAGGVINGLQGPPVGPWIMGGLVGQTQGVVIEECTSAPVINVPHGTRIGGLVGIAAETTIRHSWSQGAGDARAIAGGLVAEVSGPGNIFEYSWSSMALTTTNMVFPPQGILGTGDRSLVEGQSLYYNSDAISEDSLSFSIGYPAAELSSADNYVGWPSPPWIIVDGEFPALDSQLTP